MEHSWLFASFVFLLAACVVVPLTGRFKLGSVLGYLMAGIAIGPYGLGLIENGESIGHFAEFGVVMMLFLIGLELEPEQLWKLRRQIVVLGGLQVVLTSVAFMAAGMAWGFGWQESLAVGMALALSSTAIALQTMQEKGLLHSLAGESTFSVLLFQDMAVIPILILIPFLAGGEAVSAHGDSLIADFPVALRTVIIIAAIAGIVVGGRYLSHYAFSYIARANMREVFTATSLLLVVGITLAMNALGLSPALGAFIAGVMLASSEYKHTIETDIEPFKGLLLGLFFISIGMGMNFSLVMKAPWQIASGVLVLTSIKIFVLWASGRYFGLRDGALAIFTLMLAQGGEFAFVLFQLMTDVRLLNADASAQLTMIVVFSMVLSPLLLIMGDRFIIPRFMSILPQFQTENMPQQQHRVILIGYGRFGQIIGRFLHAQDINITILEKDPDQIELLRRFGLGDKVFFGDASRLELLKKAGADKAGLLVIAIDDADTALEIAQLAKTEFPRMKIYARARNRRHAYELHKAGVEMFRRETFDSALYMAGEVLKFLGGRAYDVRRQSIRFLKHDEKTLHESFAFFQKEPELISFARQARKELENILQSDERHEETQDTTPWER